VRYIRTSPTVNDWLRLSEVLASHRYWLTMGGVGQVF
jgi:hypothetical protein